jgi:hypothetical protein
MAVYKKLPMSKVDPLMDLLIVNMKKEHEQAYALNLSQAKSKKQKAKCSGRYTGSWYRLMQAWINNDVSNLHVRDCLKADIVIGDPEGVAFTYC